MGDRPIYLNPFISNINRFTCQGSILKPEVPSNKRPQGTKFRDASVVLVYVNCRLGVMIHLNGGAAERGKGAANPGTEDFR